MRPRVGFVLSVFSFIVGVAAVRAEPFRGSPHSIPGFVEAEDFDAGDAEVAYHDLTKANHGADYRGQSQVDIERRADASNHHGIGWTRAGEWINYTVQTDEPGTYTLEIPVASAKAGGRLSDEGGDGLRWPFRKRRRHRLLSLHPQQNPARTSEIAMSMEVACKAITDMSQKFNTNLDATTNICHDLAGKSRHAGRSSRRAILAAGAAFATTAAAGKFGRAAVMDDLFVGNASVDTTPPNGIELAGFHRPPGNPRLITGSRQPAAARVIVLEKGPVKAAIVVLDIIAVSAEFARRFARVVEDRLGIAADHVRVCASHTHSMPTFLPLRQWGAVPEAYRSLVMERGLEAVERAWHDRSAARLLVGSSRVEGGNFNRTVKPGQARTDADFGPASDDSERWLDTMLHALVFERAGGKPPIIAYHFSAHPVCFNDSLSGPDWVGVVAENCRATRGVDPLFLQGHSGDVNPGDGTKWIGEVGPTARVISKGLDAALEAARETAIDRLDSIRQPLDLPLDLDLYREWLAAYRADPVACSKGPWVDAGFAAEWFQAARAAEDSPRALRTTLSSLRLGPVAMLFHPAELYSCYGLAIRRDSGAVTTLCVGYTDDFVGYVTDPAAYARGEYASLTVPKLLDLPPFTTEAGRHLTATATALLAARS